MRKLDDSKVKKIYDTDFHSLNLKVSDFQYQSELTKSLDEFSGDFDQSKINEIVLWKVNRYASLEETGVLDLINQINPASAELDENLTEKILRILLPSKVKGVRLPMASTILRFRNPHVYQIIDQRVFRYINGCPIEYSRDIGKQITLYLNYLKRLREVCNEFGIDFEIADRILYLADKKANKGIALKNYGTVSKYS